MYKFFEGEDTPIFKRFIHQTPYAQPYNYNNTITHILVLII